MDYETYNCCGTRRYNCHNNFVSACHSTVLVTPFLFFSVFAFLLLCLEDTYIPICVLNFSSQIYQFIIHHLETLLVSYLMISKGLLYPLLRGFHAAED